MAGSVKDELKEASKSYLTAASLFDKLKIEVGNLRTPDHGLDLTEQNLLMCFYMMRGQAQYCAHEKIKRVTSNKYSLLSKLARQAAVYYGKAYCIATTPPMCKSPDSKALIPLLHFYEYSFLAHAYYWGALQCEDDCNKTAVGMGKAVALIRKSTEYLDDLNKLEKTLAPTVKTQFKELAQHYFEKKSYLEEQNRKIYNETIPSQLEELEQLPFGQPVSIDAELIKPFEGQEVFVHLVPVAVRALEEEYKSEVGVLMNQGFTAAKQTDDTEKAFMAKHNLPTCLHAVTQDQSIPEDLWQKIRQYKEKGGVAGLQQILTGVANLANNNADTLAKLSQQLQQEEEEDQAMRGKYGSVWNRAPSTSLNQGAKKQIEYYTQKYQQGKQADEKIKTTLESKKPQMALLDLDRGELAAKIPKSLGGSSELSPAAAR